MSKWHVLCHFYFFYTRRVKICWVNIITNRNDMLQVLVIVLLIAQFSTKKAWHGSFFGHCALLLWWVHHSWKANYLRNENMYHKIRKCWFKSICVLCAVIWLLCKFVTKVIWKHLSSVQMINDDLWSLMPPNSLITCLNRL